MTFTEIQTEVDSLTTEEQDKLAAYLTLRQKERDPEWNDRISKKIQNKQADRWIPLEQLNS
jgi:hypothetical protein